MCGAIVIEYTCIVAEQVYTPPACDNLINRGNYICFNYYVRAEAHDLFRAVNQFDGLPDLVERPSHAATRPPSATNSLTIARPMPEPAPVTTTTFPSYFMGQNLFVGI